MGCDPEKRAPGTYRCATDPLRYLQVTLAN
jgi:hypothetical protein